MITITSIKADVGSIGGHTAPSAEMLPIQELEYGAFRQSLGVLEERFGVRGREASVDGRNLVTARN